MALQQIDVDTPYPGGERGVPQRTANIITNENAAETEQRLTDLESGNPQVEQQLAAHGQTLAVHDQKLATQQQDLAAHQQRLDSLDGEVENLAAGVADAGIALQAEAEARAGGDQALLDAILQNLGRSCVINGNFDVQQRPGASFSAGYGPDCWFIESGAVSNPSLSRVAVAPGSPGFKSNPDYCGRLAFSGNTDAAGHYFLAQHRVENVRMHAGRDSVLSFTVYNPGAAGRQISVEFIRNYGGAGASPTETGLSVKKVTLAAGFNYVSVPVSLPSVAGKTIKADSYVAITLWPTAGTAYAARTDSLGAQSGPVEFGEVQWEEGTVATAYAKRLYATELMLCQRYCRFGYIALRGVSPATSAGGAGTFVTCQMRTPPSVTFSNVGYAYGCSGIGATTHLYGVEIYVTATGSFAFGANYLFDAGL